MFHAKSSSIINSMTGHLPFTKGQWHLFRGKPDRSRAASALRVTPGPRVNSVPLGTSSRRMEWVDDVLGVAVTTMPTPVTPAPASVW